MPPPSLLYETLLNLLQHAPWRDRRHLLTLATCAVQVTYATRNKDPDAHRLNELSHAFNFPEIRKTSITSPTFLALCSSPTDAFTLIDAKSLLIPFARTSMLITFSPVKDIGAHSQCQQRKQQPSSTSESTSTKEAYPYK